MNQIDRRIEKEIELPRERELAQSRESLTYVQYMPITVQEIYHILNFVAPCLPIHSETVTTIKPHFALLSRLALRRDLPVALCIADEDIMVAVGCGICGAGVSAGCACNDGGKGGREEGCKDGGATHFV